MVTLARGLAAEGTSSLSDSKNERGTVTVAARCARRKSCAGSVLEPGGRANADHSCGANADSGVVSAESLPICNCGGAWAGFGRAGPR